MRGIAFRSLYTLLSLIFLSVYKVLPSKSIPSLWEERISLSVVNTKWAEDLSTDTYDSVWEKYSEKSSTVSFESQSITILFPPFNSSAIYRI